MRMRMHTHTHMHAGACTPAGTCTCTRAHVHAHAHLQAHTCKRTRARTHTATTFFQVFPSREMSEENEANEGDPFGDPFGAEQGEAENSDGGTSGGGRGSSAYDQIHKLIDSLQSARSCCKLVFVENQGDVGDYMAWCKRLISAAQLEVVRQKVEFCTTSVRLTLDHMIRTDMQLKQEREKGLLPCLTDVLYIIDRDIKMKLEYDLEKSQWDEKWASIGGWVPGGSKAYHRTGVRSLENYLFRLDPMLELLGDDAWHKLHRLLFDKVRGKSIVDGAIFLVKSTIQKFLRSVVNNPARMSRRSSQLLTSPLISFPSATRRASDGRVRWNWHSRRRLSRPTRTTTPLHC